MPQSEEAKKIIAATINKYINTILKEGPHKKIMLEAKNQIEYALRNHTITPVEAEKDIIRYHDSAYEQIKIHKGLQLYTIIGDEESESSQNSPFNLSNEEFRFLQPALEKALQDSIEQVKDFASAYQDQEIAEALDDFEQWAYAVPSGGTKDKDFRATARIARSSIKSTASWNERFFIIHQNDFYAWVKHIFMCHKYGVIAGEWSVSIYPECEQHHDWDGKIFYMRDSWAQKNGLLQIADSDYFDNNPLPGTNGCSCGYDYLFSLGKLPDSVLTIQGRKKLLESRAQLGKLLESVNNKGKSKKSWWKNLFKME